MSGAWEARTVRDNIAQVRGGGIDPTPSARPLARTSGARGTTAPPNLIPTSWGATSGVHAKPTLSLRRAACARVC
eukprot:2471147-Prymnesium_polylepis.1